jgi:hypothetical protein
MGVRVSDDVGGCPRDADFRRNLIRACRSESDDVGVGWGKDWGKRSKLDWLPSSNLGHAWGQCHREPLWRPRSLNVKLSYCRCCSFYANRFTYPRRRGPTRPRGARTWERSDFLRSHRAPPNEQGAPLGRTRGADLRVGSPPCAPNSVNPRGPRRCLGMPT